VHVIGFPYHWGRKGLVTGDGANELLSIALDYNVHISEYKVATCAIRPGRRPTGRARVELVEEYRRRGQGQRESVHDVAESE
jgi:formate dehydrogenase major subunit